MFRDSVNNDKYDCKNCYFKLTDSIDLESDENNQHIAIGSPFAPFNGHFDGDNHSIRNIIIYKGVWQANNDTGDYQGLFGYIGESGSVKNLSVSGYIVGLRYVGGIAGYSDGVIENCTNYCIIHSDNYKDSFSRLAVYSGLAGGIVGSSGSDIINCGNFGTVFGDLEDIVGHGKYCVGWFGGYRRRQPRRKYIELL